MSLKVLSEHKAFSGTVGYYQHHAESTDCEMKFSVYLPANKSVNEKMPVLYYLAGLTCTEETFMVKAGAQQYAARHGLILVAADTSPRGGQVPDDNAWDFAQGAGFYLNASQSPWSAHYRMYDYISKELPYFIEQHFPADKDRRGIFGHSMGGHGALTIFLKNTHRYRSVSAFAPICAPMQCSWGENAFKQYLGSADKESWKQYDANELLGSVLETSSLPEILIDQGLSDQFLAEQLNIDLFEATAKQKKLKLILRRHEGYDHGYFFIMTFMQDHLEHHATLLKA